MRIVGPWVAVEIVQRVRTPGGAIMLPTQRRAEPTFGGLILAIGEELGETPFEVGDFVLVEAQCGNPAQASEAPAWLRADGRMMPGRTVATMLSAGLFGGAPHRHCGLVPWLPDGLPACDRDEEAVRRLHRCNEIITFEHGRRRGIEQKADKTNEAILLEHKRWLVDHEEWRIGRSRTQLHAPTYDTADGQGIIARFEDLGEMLNAGFDPTHLSEIVERRPVLH